LAVEEELNVLSDAHVQAGAFVGLHAVDAAAL
jgi:hypothetical protein